MGQFQRILKIMLYYISLACFFAVVSPKYVNPMVDIGLIEEVITITDDASASNPVSVVDDTRNIPIRPVVDPIDEETIIIITDDASSNPVSVGVNEGVSVSPFANATSVFCGSKVDTFQAVIGARLRLHCGLAGSATTVDSPTCVKGVTEALHSCSGLSRLDMEQCLVTAVLRLDGDVCGLPTNTPYGPARTTLCNALFHMEDTMKSSVSTFCIADAKTIAGGKCDWLKWLECAADIAIAIALCCLPICTPRSIPCLIGALPGNCIDCVI